MDRREARWRGRVAVVAALATFAGVASAHAADLDPAQISAEEIKALEGRLTDADCYKGAIDGTASPALEVAVKTCPDQRPFLRIETGMHTAAINSISVNAACSLVATASNDKTVRLWSLPDGKLQRIVRLPIGEGNAGKVFATALSPDGRWLAAGGWDASMEKILKNSLTMVDLSDGAIRHFGAFNNVINRIVFSPDGRRIAVGLARSGGVRVLDSASGAELLADRLYRDGVYGLSFSPDGALIASSYDGWLRRYGPDLKLAAARAAPDGKEPHGVAIGPSGRLVAVGYFDQPLVSILDAKTLAQLAKAETSDAGRGGLWAVTWSRDGATLAAGGDAEAQFEGETRQFLRRFDATGRPQSEDIPVSLNTIMGIQPCGEGFVFGAQDPSLGLVSAQGVATTLQGPRTADMRGSGLAVSRDASSVRFGLGYGGEKPVIFDLAAALLSDSSSLPDGFSLAQTAGLPIGNWENHYPPRFNGARLVLDPFELSRALAIRRDASGFALGTEFWVRAYDANGKELWKRQGPGAARAVDFSADGEILVVAYVGGTIRWLRWIDGEELLALFVEPHSRKWVAWTPNGYYMASAGGEALIGWHLNRGWDQEPDFFPASQFSDEYNRPDIVRLVLQTRDEADAIRRANALLTKPIETKPIAAALPPVVAIESPKNGAHFSGHSVEIAYSLRSPSGLPVDRLDVLADGQPIVATGFEKTNARKAHGKIAVTLPRSDTNVALIAYSGDLTSVPVTVRLRYDGPRRND